MTTLSVIFGSVVNALIVSAIMRRLVGAPIGWPRTIALSLIVNAGAAPLMEWGLQELGVPLEAVDQTTEQTAALVLIVILFLGWLVAASVGLLAILEALAPTGTLPGPVQFVTSIPGRIRRGRRFAAILWILLRRGLGRYLTRGKTQAESDDRTGVALREALTDGGVTFIKLGQMLSTRPDLLPEAYIRELSHLHSSVPAQDWSVVSATLAHELGAPAEDVFAHIDLEPLAAASVGQVYRARLHSGQDVVVKVQRSDARRTVTADLDIVLRLARMLERRAQWARNLSTTSLAEGFRRSLEEELDYRVEQRNLRAITTDGPIVVPASYPALSTRRVLTMQALDGVPLSSAGPRIHDLPQPRRRELAEQLLVAVMRQVLVSGTFHADLHGGNVLLLSDGRLALLDFGAVGRLDRSARSALAMLLLAIDHQDGAAATSALRELLEVPDAVDDRRLEREIADLIMRFGTGAGTDEMFTALLSTVVSHGLRVPPQIAAAFRALGALEGTLRLMVPDLDLVAVAREQAQAVSQEAFSPQALNDELKQQVAANIPVLQRLPRRVASIADRLDAGTLTVRLGNAAQPPQRVLTAMIQQIVLTLLAATSAACGLALALSQTGPMMTPKLRLTTYLGLVLLLFAFVLGARAVVRVFRDPQASGTP